MPDLNFWRLMQSVFADLTLMGLTGGCAAAPPETAASPAEVTPTQPLAPEVTPTAQALTQSTLLWPDLQFEQCHAGIIGYVVYSEAPSSDADAGAYLLCADGTSPQRVVSGIQRPYGLEMDLSPDHRMLAMTGLPGTDPSTPSLQLLNLSAHTQQQIAASRPYLQRWFPRWSSESEYVGYVESVSTQTLDLTLMIVHADSGTISALVTKSDLYFWDWSPDGKRVLLWYVVEPGQNEHAETLRADITCDESHRCQLSNEEVVQLLGMSPVWAPDSERIVTVRGRGAALDITDSDGKAITSFKAADLRKSMTIVGPVYWSPDGQHLALIAETAYGSQTLSILNIADGTLTDVLTAPKGAYFMLTGWYP